MQMARLRIIINIIVITSSIRLRLAVENVSASHGRGKDKKISAVLSYSVHNSAI